MASFKSRRKMKMATLSRNSSINTWIQVWLSREGRKQLTEEPAGCGCWMWQTVWMSFKSMKHRGFTNFKKSYQARNTSSDLIRVRSKSEEVLPSALRRTSASFVAQMLLRRKPLFTSRLRETHKLVKLTSDSNTSSRSTQILSKTLSLCNPNKSPTRSPTPPRMRSWTTTASTMTQSTTSCQNARTPSPPRKKSPTPSTTRSNQKAKPEEQSGRTKISA